MLKRLKGVSQSQHVACFAKLCKTIGTLGAFFHMSQMSYLAAYSMVRRTPSKCVLVLVSWVYLPGSFCVVLACVWFVLANVTSSQGL